VGFVTYLPLFVVSGVFFFVVGPKVLAVQQSQGAAVVAIVQALLNAVFIVFAAASLSWLYRRYAQELLTHAHDQPH
jgi:membrane protein implicated in regulation of membrane protease activity